MKKTLALLTALSLTGCSALTDSPDPMANLSADDALEQLPADTRPADGVNPDQSAEEALLMLGDYQVSLQLPAGLAAKNPEWEARPTMIIIAPEDMIDMEGDFFFHSIVLKEDQQVSLEMSFLESYYTSFEPMTVEIAGTEMQRILFTSEMFPEQSVSYLQQFENDILQFNPANEGTPNGEDDLQLMEIIEGFEIESEL